jgi:hypothetical protein
MTLTCKIEGMKKLCSLALLEKHVIYPNEISFANHFFFNFS